MDLYAENFRREKIRSGKDLVYFGRVETERHLSLIHILQLDMSVILKKPHNGVPIFIGAGGYTVVRCV